MSPRRVALLALLVFGCPSRPAPTDVRAVTIAAPPPPASVTDSGAPVEPASPRAPAVDLAMGPGRICLLRGGKAHCGDGADPNRGIFAEPPLGGFEDVTSVAYGQGFVCVSTARGAVHCAGDNSFGQLGAGLREERHDGFVKVSEVEGARQVAAGAFHACALLASGRVRCWGRNDSGQTAGPASYAQEARELVAAVEVPGVEGVASLTMGWGTTCALGKDRGLTCWGQAKAEEHERLRGNENEQPARLPSLDGFEQLAGAEGAFCGTRDGGVRCFGDVYTLLVSGRPPGRIAVVPMARARAVRIASDHGCALLEDGGVACFGAAYGGALGRATTGPDYEAKPPEVVQGLPPVVAVGVSWGQSCALTAAGDLYCWGAFRGEGLPERREVSPVRMRLD